jgi:hypothetical protein
VDDHVHVGIQTVFDRLGAGAVGRGGFPVPVRLIRDRPQLGNSIGGRFQFEVRVLPPLATILM